MTDRQTVSTADYEKLKRENERLKLIESRIHNLLFDNANSMPDGLFYELRGILRNPDKV